MGQRPRRVMPKGGVIPFPKGAACFKCGHVNRVGARFCGECAATLEVPAVCDRCGASSQRGQRFCDACGHPLRERPTAARDTRYDLPAHLIDRLLAARAALEACASRDGERKTITALFADIKGSVELMQDLDPEDACDLVDPALEMMIESVHEFDGYVDKCTGDGILALFGAPIAHEDHAQRAALAALRMQERIGDRHRPPLQLRIGLNSGEVVLRSIRKDDLHAEYTPIGHSTNLAARMESLAIPGHVLASENTYRLAEGYLEFKPMGPVAVKGIRDPVQTYEVVGLGPLRTRFDRATRHGLARFVGRQAELAQLRTAFAQVCTGHGQVVTVVSEPGIGKSRLFHEFKRHAAPDALMLEASAVAYGRSHPYQPVIEMLRACFEIVPADDAELRRQKIARTVRELDPELENTLPYLYHLLGVADLASSLQQMDASIRRRRTFDALKRLVLCETLHRPVVLIFQDLQWIDGETQAFLDVLVESLASVRLMLLVNYRPEYQHTWARKTFYAQLPLDALSPESSDEMLTGLLGGPAPHELRRLISEKSDGNPFFIEEIVQTLFDRGVLRRTSAGAELTRPLDTVAIPPTVQGVLAARIDRLQPREKALLQTLAVIGRSFSFALVEHVTKGDEDEPLEVIEALQAAEFVHERHTSSGLQYAFKHALTHDVAYGSLLAPRRRKLHERTAHAIEALHRNRPEDHYEELARHYRVSGNTEKAVEYLGLAGQQAVQRSAHSEAVAHFTEALGLLSALPEGAERTQRELALQVALGAPLALTKGYAAPEVGAARARARALCQEVGETPQLFPVLFGLWAFNLVRGELHTAYDIGQQLLSIGVASSDRALLLEAHRAVGASLFFRGEFRRAHEHLEAGFTLYDRAQHSTHAFLFGQDPGVSCLSYDAIVLWHLGQPDEAATMARAAIALAERIGHPFTLAFALDMAAAVAEFRRETQPTYERAARAVSLSVEQGFPLWSAYGKVLCGWAVVHEKRTVDQMRQLRDGLEAWRATGAQVCGPYLVAMLADAYGVVGDAEAGLSLLAEAIRMVDQTGERWWEPEIRRLTGALLIKSGPARRADAEQAFRDAIACAHRHGAAGLELRAATSLAHLLDAQGRRRDALAALQPACEPFVGRCESADVEEAIALLELLKQ